MLKTISALLILISFNAAADDVVITVTGRVKALPCTVDTTQLKIDLGRIYASDLAKYQSSTQFVSSDIKLSNCTAYGVTATLSGKPTSLSPYAFANEGTAENVVLDVMWLFGNNPHNESTSYRKVRSDGTANFRLVTRARAPDGNAVDGTIRGTVNVTYTYN